MSDPDTERFFEAIEQMLFGKYRGQVTSNTDPLNQGRVEVKVPSVFGDGITKWALPCVPYAGNNVGFFAIPPVGASVWVEFEGGARDFPIWTGCFWTEAETLPDTDPMTKVLKTPGGKITVKDDGTIEIETTGGAKVTMNATEISLEAPMIKQSAQGGSAEVSAAGFNAQNGAFTVV